MKKVLLILAVISTLTSCVVESYEKPPKTLIGYHIANEESKEMRKISSLADIVRVAEMWRYAETEQDKYVVEDKYFGPDVKLRVYEDTITIGGIFKIKTFNKPLSESHWEVFGDFNDPNSRLFYKVYFTPPSSYKVSALSASSELLGELTVDMITPDKEYAVTGKVNIINDIFYPKMDKFLYEINTELKFYFKDTQLILSNWYGSSNPQEGKVNIAVFKDGVSVDKDKTSVNYRTNGMEISYRGFTDFYWHDNGMYNYNYYYYYYN